MRARSVRGKRPRWPLLGVSFLLVQGPSAAPAAEAATQAATANDLIQSFPLRRADQARRAGDEAEGIPPRFTRVDPESVGIAFVNRLEIRNIRNYLMNGAGLAVGDYDGDGALDLVLAQNFFHPQRETGRMNAGLGLVLAGDGAGGFTPLRPSASGLVLREDMRALAVADVTGDHAPDVVVGVNDGPVRVLGNRSPAAWGSLRLAGPPGNPCAVGARVELRLPDGRGVVVREIQAGGGYLTQAPPVVPVPLDRVGDGFTVGIAWPDGSKSEHALSREAFESAGPMAVVISHPGRPRAGR